MSEQSNNRNSYGNIFQALALFGGVKVIQILMAILRSKLIAILLGPIGMGINNLLNSTAQTVNGITGCGLQTSSVREVSKAYNSNSQDKINVIISTLKILVWFTGFLGAFIFLVFAKQLSIFAFANEEYTNAFRILSIMMIFMQVNVGQIALMQGTFHYKDIAKSTLIAQVLSLVLTIPIYYMFGEDGIVSALLIASLITVVVTAHYSHRVKFTRIKLSFKDFISNSKGMLSTGIVIALGGVISNSSSYLLNIIISRLGSIEAVGLYSAAMTIANSYVFLVLSAMTSDYVPRLSALSGDDEAQIEAINKQMVLVSIILIPLLVAFILFARQAIYILYSAEFYATIHMLEFLMLAMYFRAISWCISYAFISRGESKIFLINEILIFFISLSLKTIGFLWNEYTGIGIALVLIYIIYVIIMYVRARKRFGFTFSQEFVRICAIAIIICSAAVAVSFALGTLWIKYVLGSCILLVALVFCGIELNKRINLVANIKKRFKK
ncbi:MAG: oligosaccharide flippase family protein [Candidatus Limimorpha sp.]